MMKRIATTLAALSLLSACQTTSSSSLRPGEIMGTDIGSVLAQEAGLPLSASNEDKMNQEIDKALYFSDNGLTTRWYAGTNARIRPIGVVRDRRDRDCRRFRHGYMIDGDWLNGSAIACRERNVPWYLIANRWDRQPRFNDDPRDDDRDWSRSHRTNKGNWENLSEELSGNPANNSFDDFGPRGGSNW
ncbi:MAG: hypothetical protein HWE34_09860 [Methylocystaceae bacterium]|nr:hypothetical protein [Methylocystaceae bacterium]